MFLKLSQASLELLLPAKEDNVSLDIVADIKFSTALSILFPSINSLVTLLFVHGIQNQKTLWGAAAHLHLIISAGGTRGELRPRLSWLLPDGSIVFIDFIVLKVCWVGFCIRIVIGSDLTGFGMKGKVYSWGRRSVCLSRFLLNEIVVAPTTQVMRDGRI